MANRLIWSRQARLDLLDIYELIGVEQPAAAERCFDRIEALAILLCDQPRLGVARPPRLRRGSGCRSSGLI
ncbi:MAG: type II toxin-antitoxin system RelE/ParE family toxin [Bosea sp. (in: a-proteobacteria)]